MAGNQKVLPKRKSIRLKGYDYSRAGLYFVTVCTQGRLCLFGRIEHGRMILNDAGEMIRSLWNEIPIYYHGFNVHEFVVMPNHFHGIIQIASQTKPVGAGPRACPVNKCRQTTGQPRQTTGQPRQTTGQPQGVAPTMSLSDIVHRFKSLTTKRYIDGVNNDNWKPFHKKLWQRNYYEHIIRDHESYLNIVEYIRNNPLKWREDKYYE